MSEYFGVKITAEGLNEARLEQIRDALRAEWNIEKDEIHFEPRAGRTAKMVAMTTGGPCAMESEIEFTDRISQAVWHANGRYCPVRISIEDDANIRVFCERDYRRLMRCKK